MIGSELDSSPSTALPAPDRRATDGGQARPALPDLPGAGTPCFHCGTPCPDDRFTQDGKSFCCGGCRTVYEILIENRLGHFYDLGRQAGIRVTSSETEGRYRYLDEPALRDRLLDFADDTICKVTFHLPAIHCVACVWLLENLFQLKAGIGRSTVNFPRRDCSITFERARVRLSEVTELLASLGYEPALHSGSPEEERKDPEARRLWLRVGVAGFAFGNTMLISVASYLGLNAAHDPGLKSLFGYLALALAVPVLVFSASDYWRAAWLALRRRVVTIDLPIAAGLVALFAQSTFEVMAGHGEGYFDSLCGLIFFLLCGKLFQHKTYARLAFDRDYKSFFPLAVLRLGEAGEERVAISRLAVGDRLILRHGELVPADARLLAGEAVIDYGFVTGEADAVEKRVGEHLYAGGRQLGGRIEVETIKPVSHSYLTTLWSHEAFRKQTRDSLDTLTNRFSQRFTLTVVLVAVSALGYWTWDGDAARGIRAFVSVLIVACPCALALAAPFALGTAQRLLARRNLFLKHPQTIEALARIDTIVFDKTGTLTQPQACKVTFHGVPLSEPERAAMRTFAGQSSHPYSQRIAEALTRPSVSAGDAASGLDHVTQPTVERFAETPGSGVEGEIAGRMYLLGSTQWLESRGLRVAEASDGPAVHLAIGGAYRGRFALSAPLRPETGAMLGDLGRDYDVALLSGDTDKERERFRPWFPADARLLFHQSPLDKLEHIRALRTSGKIVLMVGDGLNDAGALRQSDVGVAVVESIGAFSPASDVILEASGIARLPRLLRFARSTVNVVRLSFLISSLYNLAGLTIAASGLLSPLICAVLMPLSSVTVVGFACGATAWEARRMGWGGNAATPADR